MKNKLFRSILIWLAIIITITVNILANALPLNGLNTGEISDSFKVYFVPAGYVFSIWGLIYLALILFGVYQTLPKQRNDQKIDKIAGLFLLSCVANCAWIFLWHYQYFIWTLLAMGVLLVSLIAIYSRLGIGNSEVKMWEKIALHLPFSIYLGWISVATIANVSDVLSFLNWGGGGLILRFGQ